MAIESGGTAPYAPTGAVMDVIDAFRNRSLPLPISGDIVTRIGVSPSLVPRTLQALRLLGLIGADGEPTTAFERLRTAPEPEFSAALADVVRAAYRDVFAFVDPAVDDATKVRDAFRSYKPIGMQDRMARLFLGLSERAHIIAEAPAIPVSTTGRIVISNSQARRPTKAAVKPSGRENPSSAPLGVSQANSPVGNPFVQGLLQSLPPIGSSWAEESRREWVQTALAAFNMMYKRPPENQEFDP